MLFTRGCLVLLVMAASACHGSDTLTSPADDAITVSSPNTNVLFGSTEQMTATGSDGRVLTNGTWGSDTSSVATVTTAGLVMPVGAGLSNIFFIAGGKQGSKQIRGLPNLNGTFAGNYNVTSCTQSGQVGDANLCGVFPVGSVGSYTFNFTQFNDVVSGRVFLAAILFDNISGAIDLGGKLSFSARAATAPPTVIDVSWNLKAPRPNTLSGEVFQVWTHIGLSGQANINGSISSFSRTSAVSSEVVPRRSVFTAPSPGASTTPTAARSRGFPRDPDRP